MPSWSPLFPSTTIWAPEVLSQPALSGTGLVGDALTCSTGTWSAAGTFSYQWRRNGFDIAGQTTNTYTLVSGDIGASITCVVGNARGASIVYATTNPVVPASGTSTETLTFDGASVTASGVVSYGTYADGSYWINGGGAPVTVSTITPASTSGSRTVNGVSATTQYHGAMINPGNADRYIATDVSTLALRQQKNFGFLEGGTLQGYDGFDITADPTNPAFNTNLNYSASLNVDPGYTSSPIVLTEGTIVKAISKTSGIGTQGRPMVSKFVPWTIVTSAPPANAFRPATALASKASNWTTANLNMARLPNLSSVGISVPSYATTLAKLRYQTWQHTYNTLSNNIVADSGGAPVYGGDFKVYTEAMLALCYDTWTAGEKLAIATMLVQHAIDIAGRAVEGGIIQDNGGHCAGRKALVTFAAYLLNDDPTLSAIIEYKAQGANYIAQPTPVGASIWGEDTQHFIITQAIIDQSREVMYTQDQLGWPEWGGDPTRGATSALDNHLDGDESLDTSVNADYRHIIPVVNIPAALALRLMGAKALFNNQVFFDYQDRHMIKRLANGSALPGSNGVDITAWVIDAWEANRGTDGLWSPDVKIVVFMSQSEGAYISESSPVYQQLTPPTLLAENLIIYQRDSAGTDAETSTVKTILTNANKSTVNPSMVVLSNALHHVGPGQLFGFVDASESGTGRLQWVDDADTGRIWARSANMVSEAVADYNDITRVVEFWWANDVDAMPNWLANMSAVYFGQNPDGSAFTLGNTRPTATIDVTAVVDHCIYDFESASESTLGRGLFKRTTPLDIVRKGPWGESNGSRFTGVQAFVDDSRFQSLGGKYGPPAFTWYNPDDHPAEEDPHGLYEAMFDFLFPTYLRTLGLPADEAAFDTITMGTNGTYADITFTPANGGVLSTKRIVKGIANPASPSDYWQEVSGFEILRNGDSEGRFYIMRLGAAGIAPKYRGTVTKVNDTTVRIEPEIPFSPGDQITFMWGSGFCRSGGGYTYPNFSSAEKLFLDLPIEYVAAYSDSSQTHRFTGFGIKTYSDAFSVPGLPPPAEYFTMGATGPYFAAASNIPANTTALRWKVDIRIPSSVASVSGTRNVFTQEALNCDFVFTTNGGATQFYFLTIKDGTGKNVKPVSTAFNGARDTWYQLEYTVDQAANEVRWSVNGVSQTTMPFSSTGNGVFNQSRRVSFCATTFGSDILHQGIQIGRLECYRTTGGVETLELSISGNAATVNAHPRKVPGSGNAT